MKNLARREYDFNADQKVKEELQIAGIPVVKLGLINNEVKTHYIGILNGFIFERAWYYWVVRGNMPLRYAQYLYDNYKDLDIRTNGIAGNDPPLKWLKNKDYNKLIKSFVNKFTDGEITIEELNKISDEFQKQGEQVINMYHIDTQLGLCKFAELIKENDIKSEIIED